MQKHFAVVTGIAMIAVAGVVVSQQSGVFDVSLKGQLMTTGFTGSRTGNTGGPPATVPPSSTPPMSRPSTPCGGSAGTCGGTCGTPGWTCGWNPRASGGSCVCSDPATTPSSNSSSSTSVCASNQFFCTIDGSGQGFGQCCNMNESCVAGACVTVAVFSSQPPAPVDACGGGCERYGLCCDGAGECNTCGSSSSSSNGGGCSSCADFICSSPTQTGCCNPSSNSCQ